MVLEKKNIFNFTSDTIAGAFGSEPQALNTRDVQPSKNVMSFSIDI